MKDQRTRIKETPLNVDVERAIAVAAVAALSEYIIDINIYHSARLRRGISPRFPCFFSLSPLPLVDKYFIRLLNQTRGVFEASQRLIFKLRRAGSIPAGSTKALESFKGTSGTRQGGRARVRRNFRQSSPTV